MNNKFTIGLIAACLAPALALGTNAVAADEEPQLLAQFEKRQSAVGTPPAAEKQQGARYVRASTLIGTKVRNQQGEDLGEVHDLVLGLRSERVHYAVLSFGGFLGVGDKLFAYPVTTFQPSLTTDELQLNVDRERLKGAPGFERSNWPNWVRDDYGKNVDRYFDYKSDEPGEANLNYVRATELIDKKLEDADGRTIGEIEDVVVNMGQGRVPYIVVEFDRGWGKGDRLHPVPLGALSFSGENRDRIVFTTPAERFDMSYGFKPGEWPNLNDPAHQREMQKHMRSAGKAGSTTDRAPETAR